MIKIFQGFQRRDNSLVFDEMFRQRKIVFHDQKGWDVDVIDGEFEIDYYDRDDTVYLMSFDDNDKLMGSVRLISTSTDHMMNGPFKYMFPNIQFCSPTIWEVTRFTSVSKFPIQKNGISSSACEILLGLCRFGLNNGIQHLIGLYEAPMARVYRRCGLQNEQLGKHRTEQHGTICVGIWEVSENHESSISQATGLEEYTRHPIKHAA